MLASVSSLVFQIVGPEKRHERLGISRLDVLGERNLATFAKLDLLHFSLSEVMWKPYYLRNGDGKPCS